MCGGSGRALWWLLCVPLFGACDCGAGAGGGGTSGSLDASSEQGDVLPDGGGTSDGGAMGRDGSAGMDASSDASAGMDASAMDASSDGSGTGRDGSAGMDASAMDASSDGSDMDAMGACDGVGRLEVDAGALSSDGFLVVMGTGPMTRVDVRDVLRGGGAPFRCRIYRGAGQGTVPNGVTVEDVVDTSGCILVGGPDASDIPGTYGFFVQVQDGCGQMVEVPIVYRGRQCITPRVDIVPSAWPPLVLGAGANHQWQVTAHDLDEVATDMGCRWCATWNLGIQSPLTAAPNLDCTSMEDWCVDCPPGGCIQRPAMCGTGMSASLRLLPTLRMHVDVRGPSKPAWIPMTLNLRYAGTSLAPCGDKEWACHLDVFERADASGGM